MQADLSGCFSILLINNGLGVNSLYKPDTATACKIWLDIER